LNDTFGFDWALEAREKMKHFILDDNHHALIDYPKQGDSFRLSIPTPEHYLPLLYALALKDRHERISFHNDKPVGGALTMTSVMIESV
jgi:4,5-DOPA dioxygenase extradiol